MSGPDHERPMASGYQPPPPSIDGYSEDARYAHNSDGMNDHPPGFVPPHNPSASTYDQQPYFPPPPTEEHGTANHGTIPRSQYDPNEYARQAGHDYDARPRDYGYGERPYAPADPWPTEGNALTPFEEEKAEAQAQRQYEEDMRRRYDRGPPRSATYDNRYDYDSQYDGADKRYGEVPRRRAPSPGSYYDYRDDRDGRRRDDRMRSDRSPTERKRDIFRGHEDSRGLGAQILGGATGALAGHELGHSLLDTIGGAIVGAFGAKVIENQLDKRKDRRRNGNQNYRDGGPDDQDDSGSRYPASSYAASRATRTEYSRSRSRPADRSRSRSRPRSARLSRSRSRPRRSPSRS